MTTGAGAGADTGFDPRLIGRFGEGGSFDFTGGASPFRGLADSIFGPEQFVGDRDLFGLFSPRPANLFGRGRSGRLSAGLTDDDGLTAEERERDGLFDLGKKFRDLDAEADKTANEQLQLLQELNQTNAEQALKTFSESREAAPSAVGGFNFLQGSPTPIPGVEGGMNQTDLLLRLLQQGRF